MRKIASAHNLFIIVFTLFFFLINPLQAQKIKIKTENGITVVYNPKKPAPSPGSPKKLILREDLVIGEEVSEEYIFSTVRSVQVDEEENMYVLDWKEVCIKVFDKSGKMVKRFGKEGQGPGEMQTPVRMHLAAGKLMIYDVGNNRISFYSLEGECLREISTGKYMFGRIAADSAENIIGFHMVPGDKILYELKKFDPELNPVMTIGTLEMERPSSVIQMERPSIVVRVLENDNIVWGDTSKYELFIVNPEGTTTRKIVKDYDPVKITEQEKEERLKPLKDRGIPDGIKFEFPKNHYPYYYFICSDEGMIYVCTYERDEEGGFYYDVFDAEGRYIARFSLPEMDLPSVVKKDKMYSLILENEEGIPVVKRYSMKWEY